jgi:hypothetical protein
MDAVLQVKVAKKISIFQKHKYINEKRTEDFRGKRGLEAGMPNTLGCKINEDY